MNEDINLIQRGMKTITLTDEQFETYLFYDEK